MKKLFRLLKSVMIIALIISAIYIFAIDTIQTLPKYADILVDDNQKVFYSPMYFIDFKIKPASHLRLTKYGEVESKDYKADETCRKHEYFIYDQGSVIWEWMESAGIFNKKERWNKDGTWNW